MGQAGMFVDHDPDRDVPGDGAAGVLGAGSRLDVVPAAGLRDDAFVDEPRQLSFDELIGELRELNRRVVGLEIRDDQTNLIASAEGEFGHLTDDSGEWSFMLGGDAPPTTEDVEFIVASWLTVRIDRQRVLEVHDISQGMIGPRIHLRIRLTGGVTITLWPAMPLGQQWTDMHTENR